MVIKNQDSIDILMNIVDSIASNKDYLSTIDGQIGDGDHGINMNKGFQLCAKKVAGRDLSLADGFIILGETLLEEIGGSMGPLYGMFFKALGDAIRDSDFITKESFLNMIKKGANEICNIGNAKEGDKTMLDTLLPAIRAYEKCLRENGDFNKCLTEMKKAAKQGCDNTKNMVAKIGRASRLGERSRGHIDAGAASCYIILESMISSMLSKLGNS